MFKGIYLQGKPHAWRGRTEIQARSRCRGHIADLLGRGLFSGRVARSSRWSTGSPDCRSVSRWATVAGQGHRIGLGRESQRWQRRRASWRATEGSARARTPNPELAYSLEDARSQTRTQSWQLNLPVELGGKRAARTKAAERSREQAQAQLIELKATVRANVAAAYFDVLTAQERLVLARDSVALAKSSDRHRRQAGGRRQGVARRRVQGPGLRRRVFALSSPRLRAKNATPCPVRSRYWERSKRLSRS